MNKISGKIINHDASYTGTIEFSEKIENVIKDSNQNLDNIIIPGFIDLHCHGGNGFDVMGGLSSILEFSKYHLKNGTTTLLPTTLTGTLKDTIHSLAGLNNYTEKNKNLTNILGVHLEGPFINPKKLGAQPACAQKPNIDFINKVSLEAQIKVITLAPELENSEIFIKNLIERNIKVQIGHSLASFDCCKKIMKNFKVGFTHLYNAMSGNHHREPGVLTAAFTYGDYAEIICDLYHVKESNIKLAHKIIPNLYAITDSISATGKSDGIYKFANLKIEKKGNQAWVDSKTLAGCAINMHDVFKNLIKINFSINDAVAMTSFNASKYMNEKRIGKIEKDYYSNVIILDKNLNIKQVYLYGNLI